MSLKIGWIVASCLAAIAAAAGGGEVELPAGATLSGGAIDDDGQVFFLARVEANSFLVRQAGERQEIFELPNTSVGSVRLLEDRRLLLDRSKIVKLRAGEIVTLWSWNHRTACPENDSMHPCSPPILSDDGKVSGEVRLDGPARARFTFGRTKKGGNSVRTEVVGLDAPYNGDFELSFWFLDSEGQVVMLPYWTWKGDAFIVHFSDRGSPYAVPLALQERDGPSALSWQRGDRLLWAGSPTGGGRWRAYHLWDLGLSGLPSEPFWEVERKDGWKLHPERGVVRAVEGDRGYRIEHLWREPWTGIEEHHVSDWQPGHAPRSVIGYGWLVSPNGRHAAVIESRSLEEEGDPNVGAPVPGEAFSVRNVAMRWQPQPLPPLEATVPAAEDAQPAKKQDPPAGP